MAIVPNQKREMKRPMSEMEHLNELRKMHEDLSKKIELEQNSPGSDSLTITELKKKKLKIKDKIQRLSKV